MSGSAEHDISSLMKLKAAKVDVDPYGYVAYEKMDAFKSVGQGRTPVENALR
ncbi:hypothetical protein [Paenibacillus silvisoli]|uniref:hypothetical protein n=1 Tax=Paenibacillus silvisoli TaxID=3110539 RepID=UPI0028061CD7|nr:hypothetical protein [Paenibacillus silvisoli]